MANTSDPKAPPVQRLVNVMELPVSNPANVQPVYSNNAAAVYSPHDFRITFTEIIVSGLTTEDPPRQELRATVSMSPTHFKALYDAMGKTLKNFEDQFGKVQWPPKAKGAVSPRTQ
jgi:hypothetical protein